MLVQSCTRIRCQCTCKMSRTTTVFGIQTAAVEAQASTYLHQRGVRLGLEFVRGVNALIKQVRARAAPVLVVCVRERVSYPWLIRHSRGIQPDEQARHVCPVVQQELLSGSPAQIPCSTVGLVHYVAWDFGVKQLPTHSTARHQHRFSFAHRKQTWAGTARPLDRSHRRPARSCER